MSINEDEKNLNSAVEDENKEASEVEETAVEETETQEEEETPVEAEEAAEETEADEPQEEAAESEETEEAEAPEEAEAEETETPEETEAEEATAEEEKAEEPAEEPETEKEEAEETEEKPAAEKKHKKSKKAEKEAAAPVPEKKKLSKKAITGIIIACVAVAACICFAVVAHKDGNTYKWLNLKNYVTVGKYKGLTYTKQKVTVTDKEVQAEIESRVKAKQSTKTVKTGTVKKGDSITIAFKGTINGKTFDRGSSDSYPLTVGSGTMIDGFEDGLIGKKVGSKVTLNLKFPKDYSTKKLRGKKVKFVVTILSKQVTVTPKYDINFIKDNSKYDNKKDYEASVKAELVKEQENTNATTVKNTLWSQVVESSKVKKYPDAQIDTEIDRITDQYKSMAKSYGMEWKTFLKSYMGVTEKQFKSEAKTYAKSVVKQKMILYSIAKEENIKLSDKEYKKKLADLLKSSGMTESEFKSQYGETLEKYAEENGFRDQMMLEKVEDNIYKSAKAKTK
ncbi:MAG: trigger factor [Eubacteriales bacterium]|nr:trigger factor [Eubacteriales bacterium]